MRLTPLPMEYGIDPWSNETVQQLPLGAIGYDPFGNKYRYSLFDVNNNAVAGNLIQSVPQPSNFVDLAVAAAAPLNTSNPGAAGQPGKSGPNKTVKVTLNGTAVTANQFVGGRFVVSVTPGIGTQYTISSHDVQTSTSGSCNFNFEENLLVALTTSSKATIMPHPYNAVVQSPTSPTGYSAGVVLWAVPKNTYCWIGCSGVFGALNDNVASSVGNGISPSTTTAGCITKAVTLKDSIGYYITAPTSAEVEPQWFNIN